MGRTPEIDVIERARQLYMTNNFSMAEIANRVGVTRESVRLWRKKYDWGSIKTKIVEANRREFDVKHAVDAAKWLENFHSAYRVLFGQLLRRLQPMTTNDNGEREIAPLDPIEIDCLAKAMDRIRKGVGEMFGWDKTPDDGTPKREFVIRYEPLAEHVRRVNDDGDVVEFGNVEEGAT